LIEKERDGKHFSRGERKGAKLRVEVLEERTRRRKIAAERKHNGRDRRERGKERGRTEARRADSSRSKSPRLLLAAASSLQSIECLLFSTQIKHAFEFFDPVPNWRIIVMRSGAKEGEGKAFSFEINALFPFLFARSGLSCETPGKSECPVLAGCPVLLLLSSSTKAHVRFSRKPSVRSGEGLNPRKGKE
jgi:hypothetical protein